MSPFSKDKDLTKGLFQKVFIIIGERDVFIKRKVRERKKSTNITSKFKLCFVIDVVTISYSLY